MSEMNACELAKLLNGMNYKVPLLSKENCDKAKASGLVVVYGASDDLIEFEGAIEDEGDCFEGGNVYINQYGVVPEDEVEDQTDVRKIRAKWCVEEAANGDVIPWTYETDIPHETFMIFDNGEPDCRGIVFHISDLYNRKNMTESEKILQKIYQAWAALSVRNDDGSMCGDQEMNEKTWDELCEYSAELFLKMKDVED